MAQTLDPEKMALYFSLFNEIGIIDQLSTTTLNNLMPEGLMYTHFGVLNHLVRLGDGRTPLSIAKAFQVAKTSMTHTLAGLEKHKLVNILPNPDDGRSKLVWLTEFGKNLRMQVIAETAPILSQTLAGFSAADIQALVDSLSKIRTIMDNNR